MSAKAGLAAALFLAFATAASAQPAGELAPIPDAPIAPTLKPFQKVEATDPENPGVWMPCTVNTAYLGAYELTCNYTRRMFRDVHVRVPGGSVMDRTAAQAVSGPPFKAGDIVLASVMSLPDDWRLCVVESNNVQSQNNYLLACAGSKYRALPQWVREDPDAPASR